MSEIDIQTVLSSRYRTSSEADRITIEMWQALGLDTKAQFARLAIGRSLALGAFLGDAPDSKGIEVPAQALFTTDNIGAWVGLLVEHSISTKSITIDSQESLRHAIRFHWHRGAVDLYRDWKESEESYDRFLDLLVSRRTEMPDAPSGRSSEAGSEENGDIALPDADEPTDGSDVLVKGLGQLNIKVQVKDFIQGPRLTRYRVLLLNLNDRSKIDKSLEKLALAMNLGEKRPSVLNGDEAMTIFIDIPRQKSKWTTVPSERLQLWSAAVEHPRTGLWCYAGVSVTGEDVAFDLASAPHLLVGGTTNSGKSVTLHSIILSLLLRSSPEDLQIALIDPKRVEFAPYSKLKNLYKGKVVVEVSEAQELLAEIVVEMESRYSYFERLGASNIVEARGKGVKIPYIVLVVEELADLVLQEKSLEPLFERLAQKARAAGIHLVLATQRPDSDTFSGLIRSNIPARIALAVQKSTESKIIIDESGAEHLLGAGDMLLKLPGEQPKRVHGAFISKEKVIGFVSQLA